MSTEKKHFSVKYDGVALDTHEMNVRDLSPALMAMADAIETANQTLFPNAPQIQVSVKGGFKEGSFDIDLSALLTIAEQVADIFLMGNTERQGRISPLCWVASD